MLNGLDLFSGIGGMSIAIREWVQPIAYCEIEPYCQSVLLSRMQEGNLPKAPIWDDIRTLPTSELPTIDIVYGSFPCQDISVAGNRAGLEGKRSSLFFEIMRISEEVNPKFLFIENVPAITSRGGLQVVREITEMGYGCRWCVISAASVGAMHRRERWFLLAHSNGEKRTGLPIREKTTQSSTRNLCQYESIDIWQKAVSEICRTTDGVPNRMERIKALGNAVVPAQARKAFQILTGLKNG